MSDTKTPGQEQDERVQQYLNAPSPKFADSTAIKAGGTAADVIGRLLWIGVFLAAALALFNFVTTYAAHYDLSAPQLAALAAESLAIAVLPYVLARAWDEVCRPPRRR